MNEAELQARFRQILTEVFPLLPADYRLEHYLHFKVGHDEFTVDGMAPGESRRGRHDMLVKVDGQAVLLVELKAPDIALQPDDFQQAWSYAALVPAPLYLVSNGKESHLRFTANKSSINLANPAQLRLETLLSNAGKLAAAQSEEAIRVLLGSSDAVWSKIFERWNQVTLAELTGEAREFRRPLVAGFSVRRDVVELINAKLGSKAPLIVVHGAPLTGVTNVLSQVAQATGQDVRLFVTSQVTKDVLQAMANRLGTETSMGISKDDLRRWFSAIRGLTRITFVLDGIPAEGLDELLEWAKDGHFQLVVGTDSEARRRARSIPGRNQETPFGRLETAFELKPLSDPEFERLAQLYAATYNAGFVNGATYAPDLRAIRNHRVIAAYLPNKGTAPAGAMTAIPAFASPDIFRAYNDAFVTDPQLRAAFQELANVYLEELDQKHADPDWIADTWGLPSIDPATARARLGDIVVTNLVDQGFLSWSESPALGPRLWIRIGDIFAHYIAFKWASDLKQQRKDSAVLRKLVRLVDFSTLVIGGAATVAAAIQLAGKDRWDIVETALNHLLSDAPTSTSLGRDAQIKILAVGQNIDVSLPDGMPGPLTGNISSWLVLSECAFWPMVEQANGHSFNFRIFSRLGTSPHLLMQFRPSQLEEHPQIPMHDVPGAGSFQTLDIGIIEPLGQAMVNHALWSLDEFEGLAAHAREIANPHLTWRIQLAARALATSVDARTAAVAQKVNREMHDWWSDFLVQVHGRGSG